MLPIQLPESTGLVVGALIYGAIAAALLHGCCIALVDAWLARSAKNWPKTSGHVLSSTTRWVYKQGYVPAIDYEYFVDGQPYRSKRIEFARAGYSGVTADALVKRYPPGRTITVHYHPRYRGQAYLKPGNDSAVLSFLTSAIGYLIGASLFVALMAATASP